MKKTTTNIAAHLPAMAARLPEELAVAVQRAAGGGRYDYEKMSFAELEAESNRMANGLAGLGVTRGMRTVLMVKPSREFFALTFALFKLGAVPVMVDPGMGMKNLKTCLAESAPEAFIGIPKAQVARVLLGWAKATLRIRVTVGRKLFWGGAALAGACAGQPDTFDAIAPESGETAAILFTSGSTGVPKGVVYTHEIFNAQVDLLRDEYGIAPGERDLSTFPLFALFGPALGMASIVPDMDASRPARTNPAHIVAAVADHEATNMFASPALIEVVGRHGEATGAKMPSLRRVISAGAPANLPSLARFSQMLGQDVEVFPSYGATEALPVTHIGTKELLATAPATDAGAGICVGKPVRGVEVGVITISDDPIPEWHDGLCLPQSETGEVVVRGPVVTEAYFRREDSTKLAKIRGADGRVWHRMGDLGYFDETGRLWMCGRKAHRVQTETGDLFTIPCERVFHAHPAVRRAALVGVGEPGYMRPVLCVETESRTHDEEALRRDLLLLAAGNARTAAIETFLFHPNFPVDVRHNAKIFREKLAVWAARKLS